MPIRVQCPNEACGKVMMVKDQFAGTKGKCPDCGQAVLVPALATDDLPPTKKIKKPASAPVEPPLPATKKIKRPPQGPL
ncbi:MAG: hypothetical protein K2R98_24865 [Gemmataceae bacterium]|nr:hypothetical protein [Gemmataceae bacterium]